MRSSRGDCTCSIPRSFFPSRVQYNYPAPISGPRGTKVLRTILDQRVRVIILRHNAQQSTHCREMRKLDQKILIHSLLCVYSGSRTISKLLWLLRCRSRNNPAENNGSKNDDDTSACDSRHRLTSSTTHMLCRWHTLQTWFDIIAHWHAGRESTPAESCVRTYIVKCPAYQKYQSGAASFRVASSLDTQH